MDDALGAAAVEAGDGLVALLAGVLVAREDAVAFADMLDRARPPDDTGLERKVRISTRSVNVESSLMSCPRKAASLT